MENTAFNNIITEGNRRRVEMMTKKGHDYDKVEVDRLSSFKKVAIICKELDIDCHTPSGVAAVLLVLKLVRDANLKSSGKDPFNESRTDTADDMHNYIDLKTCCEIDEVELALRRAGTT